MAIGVYLTYRILDVADLTVDGSLGTGGAVCVVLVLNGAPVGGALVAATLAGMLAGLVTGLFHTACGIPAILAGILTQLALYSVNLRIMGTGTGGGKANLPISVDKYGLLVFGPVCPCAGTQQSDYRAAYLLRAPHRRAVLVLRHRAWLRPARDRCQPAHGSCAGHQHHVAIVLGLMISNGLVALAGGLLAQYQGFSTSTWAAVPSSSVWRRSSSVRSCSARSSATLH